MFEYSDTNKRYHTLTYANKQKYGCKVAKLCINAGYTCPNKDGTKATGGCLFCGPDEVPKAIPNQIIQQRDIIKRKWPDAKYQLYFQTASNTYAELVVNKTNFDLYQSIPGVVSLAVATRADTLDDSTLAYLDELTKDIDVTIEIGLQTMFDETRNRMNCHYSLEDFLSCINRIALTNCSITTHLINGLPGETAAMMTETAKLLGTLPVHGIKIHMLYLDSASLLGALYQKSPFPLLTREEYTDIVIEQLTYLRKEQVIHRLTGDSREDRLLAPLWTLNKVAILNEIDKKMAKRNICQADNA